MSFCQICRHESPTHEPNCPVLTGEPQPGVQWITQAQLLPQVSGQQAMGSDPNQILRFEYMQPIDIVTPIRKLKAKADALAQPTEFTQGYQFALDHVLQLVEVLQVRLDTRLALEHGEAQ